MLLAILADLSGLLRRPPTVAPLANPLDGATFTRLTDFAGDEFDAAISPDGRFVAFISDRDGPFDVFVGQTDSREFLNITRKQKLDIGSNVYASSGVRRVGFSGDGSSIWFGGLPRDGLRILPLLGGPARNFLSQEVAEVEWSPDAQQIVYHLGIAGDPIYVSDPSGANANLILPFTEGHHQHFPIWSRDGQWFYLVRGRPITGEMDLWRVHPDGSKLERLTEGLRNVTYPVPLDDRTVLFCAHEPDGAGPWLWALDTETKEYKRASVGVEYYSSVSASADGRRIVATVANPQATVWRIPIQDRVATESDAAPLPLPPFAPWLPGLVVTSSSTAPRAAPETGCGNVRMEIHRDLGWGRRPAARSARPVARRAGAGPHSATRRTIAAACPTCGRCRASGADGSRRGAHRFLVARWPLDRRGGWKDGVQGLYRVPLDGGCLRQSCLGRH